MKSHTRRVSTVAAALVLSFNLAAYAGPNGPREDRGRDLPAKIVRILQKLFGVSAQDSQPIPPKP